MKRFQKTLSAWRTRRGAALLMVLACIAMLSIFVVALLSGSNRERISSVAFEESIATRNLSDLPVNIVMGQIRKATSGLGTEKTWASQPGMIRVFGNDQSGTSLKSKLDKAFRLYSSEKLTSEGTDFDPALEVPPADWASKPAGWTDLNEPAFLYGGTTPEAVYPIIDATPPNQIEGFSVASAPGATTQQPAPMPVRWMYVLQDGQIISPTGIAATEVTFASGASGPSADNPIVGRIAFWADDEGSKLNFNTASEGIPWDTPRGNADTEAKAYADRQPVRNEFQRYPGHPASVSLSPVFRQIFGYNPDAVINATNNPNAYFRFTPRVNVGGSNGGVDRVTKDTSYVKADNDRLFPSVEEAYFGTVWDAGNQKRKFNVPVTTYSGSTPLLTEDFLSKAAFFTTTSSRSPELNLFNQPRISLWPLMRDKNMDRNALDRLLAFCSTASNQPFYFQRESVCELTGSATIGSSQNTKKDWLIERNQKLMDYLVALTDRNTPGLGGSLKAKLGDDQEQVLTEMLDYIRSGANVYAIGAGNLPTGRSTNGYAYSPPRQVNGMSARYGEGSVIPLHVERGGNTFMGFGRAVTVTEATLVVYPTAVDTTQVLDYPNGPDGTTIKGHPAQRVRAYLLLEFFSPSVGNPTWTPYINVRVNGLNQFGLGSAGNLNMPATGTVQLHTPAGYVPNSGDAVGAGHVSAFPTNFIQFFHGSGTRRNVFSQDAVTGFAWHSLSDLTITGTGPQQLIGAGLSVEIRNHDNSDLVQTVNLRFPDCTVPPIFGYLKESGGAVQAIEPYETSLQARLEKLPVDYAAFLLRPGDVCRSVEAGNGGENPANVTADANPPTHNVTAIPGYAPPKGDFRLYAATPNVPENWFVPGGPYDRGIGQQSYFNPSRRFVSGFRLGHFWQYWGHLCTEPRAVGNYEVVDGYRQDNPYHKASSFQVGGSLTPELYYDYANLDAQPNYRPYRDAVQTCARGLQAARRADGRLGDWDNGFGSLEDGCFINKPDDTNSCFEARADWDGGITDGAAGGYFHRGSYNIDQNSVNHAPNRQISSAMQMGSLPTGVKRVQPFQTLLFSPMPAGRTTASTSKPTKSDHPGFAATGETAEHAIADLFWMPSVEPYALSEPFSSAGKINMNYDILPFRYIKRRTGVISALRSTVMGAIKPEANRQPRGRSLRGGRDQAYDQEIRYDINEDPTTGTLKGFEDRFNTEKDIFRSATEICEIFLVPKKRASSYFPGGANPVYPSDAAPTYNNVVDWWQNFRGTGDNLREMPYRNLHSLLTTRSNAFTIHYRVQYLKKARSGSPTVWNEEKDQVLGENRGSTLVERYIDPNDQRLPDYAGNVSNPATVQMDEFYRFRIIRKRQFAP